MKRQKKVMIVDDESIVCERLKPPLEKDGFYVETFTEGQAAIDRLSVERFDVLVTDLKMRRPNGIDILNFVRQSTPGTKVIAQPVLEQMEQLQLMTRARSVVTS